MHWISFLFLRLLLIIIVLPSSVYAEEEWTIDKFKTLSYAKVSGEVRHGDNLNFFILSEANCVSFGRQKINQRAFKELLEPIRQDPLEKCITIRCNIEI